MKNSRELIQDEDPLYTVYVPLGLEDWQRMKRFRFGVPRLAWSRIFLLVFFSLSALLALYCGIRFPDDRRMMFGMAIVMTLFILLDVWLPTSTAHIMTAYGRKAVISSGSAFFRCAFFVGGLSVRGVSGTVHWYPYRRIRRILCLKDEYIFFLPKPDRILLVPARSFTEREWDAFGEFLKSVARGRHIRFRMVNKSI